MNIYQASCSLPSEPAFIFAARFVEESRQWAHGKRSEQQEKVQSFPNQTSDYLKFKWLKLRNDEGLWRTM